MQNRRLDELYLFATIHRLSIYCFANNLCSMKIHENEAVMMRVSPRIHAELVRYAGELQAEQGRRVYLYEAIERLLELEEAQRARKGDAF